MRLPEGPAGDALRRFRPCPVGQLPSPLGEKVPEGRMRGYLFGFVREQNPLTLTSPQGERVL